MNSVSTQTASNLSRLREIGWTLWDPIGLLSAGLGSASENALADEYDEYLLCACDQIRHGISNEDVVAYLMNIEEVHMCMGKRPDAHERALAVVQAIQSG